MSILKNINWVLLRKQREWLLKNDSAEAMGLSHLLYYIQADAVANQGFSNEEIYGVLLDAYNS
jgi:hypothetical protein